MAEEKDQAENQMQDLTIRIRKLPPKVAQSIILEVISRKGDADIHIEYGQWPPTKNPTSPITHRNTP